jgi:serine/threonine-protein phosphatase 2A regulatory subunit B'
MQELQDMLNDSKFVNSVVVPNLGPIMDMISYNIFRPLPSSKKALGQAETGEEAEEQMIDPAWPHLQGIYEFFLQLIVNEATDVKSLKYHINHSFIQDLQELVDSEEPRERDYLKNILHRLYAKLVPRRKMIRKAINDCFYEFI